MIKIAVLVITYRRPNGLTKLLEGLSKQKFTNFIERPLFKVIVVDNDKEKSAQEIVNNFSNLQGFDISYVAESRQGIPVARNTAIDSVPDDFDFICFIDDDEWPNDNWLDSLLETQVRNEADCVLGAVIPAFPSGAPSWIVESRIFDSWRFKDNQKIKEAASNNVMISHAFIKKHNHRFDERMRMTGGSDYLFFKQAYKLGLRIYWSDKSDVYEDIPMSRLNSSWLIQRQFRLGNTFAISERLSGTRLGLVIIAFKGLLRVCLGLLMSPFYLLSKYYGLKGVSHFLRGAGMFLGTFGHSHQEYSNTSLLKERANR